MTYEYLITFALNALLIVAIFALYMYAKNARDAKTRDFIKTFVQAAEQMFTSNDEKRAYVIARARDMFPNIRSDIIIALIESCVHDLNVETSTIERVDE